MSDTQLGVTVRIPSPTTECTVPPSTPNTITLFPSDSETIQDIKLLINDWHGAYWLGPYSLRLPVIDGAETNAEAQIRPGEKLNEWAEIGQVFSNYNERILEAVCEPYGEFSARQQVLRLAELVLPSGALANPVALLPGATIFDSVRDEAMAKHAFSEWKEWENVSLGELPVSSDPVQASDCLKSIQLSPFNPPPPHLAQRGHQLYLSVAILEGDVITLICTTRGWYVSKSNVNVFDPSPKSGVYHSLIDLLHSISPKFSLALAKLPPFQFSTDPITTTQIPQCQPAYPFLVPTPPLPSANPLRTQLALLHTGAWSADSGEGARDWNEEIQGIRELPRSKVDRQDDDESVRHGVEERVFREKMLQKVFAEFDQAAIRAVQSRGDIPPINPSEPPSSHMYLLSNIFVTPATLDSLSTLTHLGGDDAVRPSHGKDAQGVKLLNKLDVAGVYMLGHTVVEWTGKRWVCQSVLPGIFSNKDEVGEAKPDIEDNEKKEDWVDVQKSPKTSTSATISSDEDLPSNPMMTYGQDSESPSLIHWDQTTHYLFSLLAPGLKLAPHKLPDGQGRDKEFYASAEVKGLKGQDGRRYILDAQRLMCVDVEFLEKDIETCTVLNTQGNVGQKYPHRFVLLRPELIELFWESELKRWARNVAKNAKEIKTEAGGVEKDTKGELAETEVALGDDIKSKHAFPADAEHNSPALIEAATQRESSDTPLDLSLVGSLKDFKLLFNPDAFVETIDPAKPGTIQVRVSDESDPTIKAVRDASIYLRELAIPQFVLDSVTNGSTTLMDGEALSKTMHLRGINMRYLGYVAKTIEAFSKGEDGENKIVGALRVLLRLVKREMVLRASKHILRSLLYPLQLDQAPAAISHFLNCLLGAEIDPHPVAEWTPLQLSSIDEPKPEYVSFSPEGLREKIRKEVEVRFRWSLNNEDVIGLEKKQLLRELALRTGFQLVKRNYIFDPQLKPTFTPAAALTSTEKKDKKNKRGEERKKERTRVFESDDVLALVPIIKSTAPSVTIAEEILDAARTTIHRGSFDAGLEFMLEAIQLYENIHSVLHPSVAAVYNTYSNTVHQIARLKIQQLAQQENADPEQPLGVDVGTALKLQRQAVVVAERTCGVWHTDTAQYYFNLAMLENLEGNTQQALKYFRHVLRMWDVIHGPEHPEIATILNNVGIILQTMNDPHALEIQTQAHRLTLSLFGLSHIATAQSHSQLVQAQFLASNHSAALSSAKEALTIFSARLGDEDSQTKDAKKNVELLEAVVANQEMKKEREEAIKKEANDRLKAARDRLGARGSTGSTGAGARRLGTSSQQQQQTLNITPQALAALAKAAQAAQTQGGDQGESSAQNSNPVVAAAAAQAAAVVRAAGIDLTNLSKLNISPPSNSGNVEENVQTGELGTQSVEELVKYIQGSSVRPGAGGTRRGKNTLRGKRRTGAKR
ncbi:hypothetical protein L204_104492 [Cryptococcus depauperatus]